MLSGRWWRALSASITQQIENTEINGTFIKESNVGDLTSVCKFCKAKHFSIDLLTDKKIIYCCHKLKVSLQEEFTFPKE